MKVRPQRFIAAALALIATLPAAAEIVPAEVPKTEAEVRRIGAEDAKHLVDAGRAILVDVRSAASFAAEHIAGAIHIPEGEILSRKGELPKEKLVIAYCS